MNKIVFLLLVLFGFGCGSNATSPSAALPESPVPTPSPESAPAPAAESEWEPTSDQVAPPPPPPPPAVSPPDPAQHAKDYAQLRQWIKGRRSELQRAGEESASRLGAEMSRILIDSIFPYWRGTPWDFNGHTAVPRQGEIACGYFVSTTIRHLGIGINRYKVAQQAAADIIHLLCDTTSIQEFRSLDQLRAKLEERENYELLIVGLDFHVGFLYKKEDVLYFAHSNYLDRKGVEVERFDDSPALRQSNLYVLGSFSRNADMIRQWTP
ncbi:MAG: hypothetical protein AAFW73_18175 [Bacteroidota bacterium]